MSLTAFVQQIDSGQFRASIAQPISLTAEGASRDEAISRLSKLAQHQLSQGEIVEIRWAGDNPWLKFAGIWKDHPDFDAYQADIAEYRRMVDSMDSP